MLASRHTVKGIFESSLHRDQNTQNWVAGHACARTSAMGSSNFWVPAREVDATGRWALRDEASIATACSCSGGVAHGQDDRSRHHAAVPGLLGVP